MYVNKIISNNIGYLILNRTKKLNALNIDMIRELREKYCDFIKNDNVKIIVLKGNNNKNFCAGGDIVTLYKEYIINNNSPMFFFEEEFELDYLLFNSKKPIISFISGITMGGGVGLFITSSIVVADDTTKWAMPETRLGMIPDVGVGYYFSKIEKPLALYISLLGNILFGSDLTKLNIADFYIKNSSIRNIEIELEQFDFKNLSFDEMVFNAKHIISKYKIKEDYTDLSISSDKINNHFDKNKLSDIFNSLKEGNDKFSIDTLNELNNKCPLSLQMTFLKYFKCKNISILDTYMLDLKLLKYCYEIGNMKEGIRGVMIDKEYIPVFKPHSYKEVDIKLIDKLLKI